jgi:simple sugar transport system permease protein
MTEAIGGGSPAAAAPAGAPPAPEPVADERLANISLWARLLRRPEVGSLLGALVICAFFWTTTESFGTLSGIANWTDVASTLGIMAVAVALLMIGGEFDLSAGVMTGTTGLLLGLLTTEWGFSMWPAIVVTFAFAALVGFVKGYDSASKLFSNTFWSPHNFRLSVVWWIVIAAIATWVLARTRVGNWIFAVGGDANAARNVGVPVARVKIALFMTTAMAAALVGIMVALRLASVQAGQGVGEEFTYIIAAVVGGCLLTGGYGSAIGASLGALIVGMAFIGISFSGWNTDWRFLFLGVILLLAVLVNNLVRHRAEGARR